MNNIGTRNILFRGKRTDTGEWLYGNFASVNRDAYIISQTTEPDMENGGSIPSCIAVNPVTVGQFTGLTDKNGTRIFEGDIIRFTFDYPKDKTVTENGLKIRVGRVFFFDFRAEFAVAIGRNGSNRANNSLFKYVQNGNRVEVIGNIHDNPEILDTARTQKRVTARESV